MCGRYTQGRAVPELLSRYLHLGALLVASEQMLLPRFNIAPTSLVPVVFREGETFQLAPMQWGLIPRWVKPGDPMKIKPINARSEEADTGAMFRDAFRSSRCLIPATGFYEWQGSKPPKQPYRIYPTDQEIFSFAGLWSRWKNAQGTELLTCTILTTDANEAVKAVHHRMPCILHPDEEAEWIDNGTDCTRLKALLRPYPAEHMNLHRISTAVNKPGIDGPELIRTID